MAAISATRRKIHRMNIASFNLDSLDCWLCSVRESENSGISRHLPVVNLTLPAPVVLILNMLERGDFYQPSDSDIIIHDDEHRSMIYLSTS